MLSVPRLVLGIIAMGIATVASAQEWTGTASWYGKRFQGRPTASGEAFDMHAMTAAHRTLPFQTHVRVTNLENGRSVIVRINDRGPYRRDRIIDLAYAPAKLLGIVDQGTARVKVQTLQNAEFLQVGAFRSPANARRLRQRITAKGLPALVVTVRRNGGLLHCVRVGPLATQRQVRAARQGLAGMGISTTMLVHP